eukprot:m.255873 g.255873  ORF g.255873 m.255873 type:complete len:68 (-) comp19623_c0_seq22:430-633(-)
MPHQVLVAILMINLLIAMMNSTYQRISDNADIEWKFFRGKLLAGYEDIPAAPGPLCAEYTLGENRCN